MCPSVFMRVSGGHNCFITDAGDLLRSIIMWKILINCCFAFVVANHVLNDDIFYNLPTKFTQLPQFIIYIYY